MIEELISPTSTIIPSTATTPDSTNPPPQPTTAEFSIPTTNAVGSKVFIHSNTVIVLE